MIFNIVEVHVLLSYYQTIHKVQSPHSINNITTKDCIFYTKSQSFSYKQIYRVTLECLCLSYGSHGRSILLSDPRSASAFHEIVRHSLAEHAKWPLVVVASTSRPKNVNLDLYEGFLHQHTLEVSTKLNWVQHLCPIHNTEGKNNNTEHIR